MIYYLKLLSSYLPKSAKFGAFFTSKRIWFLLNRCGRDLPKPAVLVPVLGILISHVN